MAMSCLLRTTLNSCKVGHGITFFSKARPLTSLASLRLDQSVEKPKLLAPSIKFQNKPLGLLAKVENFSTTSKMAASGVPDVHDHSKIWTWERLLSIALMPIIPLGILYPNVLFDVIIAASITMHVHWGVEAVVVDYVRPIIFGKIIPKLSLGLVYVFSVVLLLGLLNLSFRGQGIGNSVLTLWSM